MEEPLYQMDAEVGAGVRKVFRMEIKAAFAVRNKAILCHRTA
jgi:hypothetical protein